MNYRSFLSEHRHKLIVGAPIIFLLLVNVSGLGGAGNYFSFSSNETLFPSVGDEVSVDLNVSTKNPVNAAGGDVRFPSDILEGNAVLRSGSVIELWSEDPVLSNASGSIHWSGGIVEESKEEGLKGKIFTMKFRALKPGKVEISIVDGQLLARDGVGTNIISGSDKMTLYIREQGAPSPDINNDGKLSIGDINALYIKTFGEYDPRYDLNRDKKLGWSDVTTLVSMM